MNMIVAIDKNWGIGINGNLLARIPEDMKYFKEKTTGNVIIMGRKTLESFPHGKPLDNRINIVLTRNSELNMEGVTFCNTIDHMLDEIKKYGDKEVFVVGGGNVYTQLLPYCDTAYITKINSEFDADTYIENLDKNENWIICDRKESKNYNGLEFSFNKYCRIVSTNLLK